MFSHSNILRFILYLRSMWNKFNTIFKSIIKGDALICVFCKKSRGKIEIFFEETLKKCQTILKLRKKKNHNRKHKGIVLPTEYTESG